MGEKAVGYQLEGTVAVLRFDDGKANALPRRAFSETKRRVRGAGVERVRRSLAEELGGVGGAG